MVDADRMAANLAMTDGLIMAEAVVVALAASVGRRRARQLVDDASRRSLDERTSFRDELLASAEVVDALGEDGIDRALDPANYLGSAAALVDRALAAWKETDL